MRLQGIEDIGDVKKACLESDGHFSFIKKDDDGEQQSNPKDKKTVN